MLQRLQSALILYGHLIAQLYEKEKEKKKKKL